MLNSVIAKYKWDGFSEKIYVQDCSGTKEYFTLFLIQTGSDSKFTLLYSNV